MSLEHTMARKIRPRFLLQGLDRSDSYKSHCPKCSTCSEVDIDDTFFSGSDRLHYKQDNFLDIFSRKSI